MEIVEALCCGFLVESLMEGHDVGIGVAVVLPVVVDAVGTEVHHGIDEGLHVFIGAVRVLGGAELGPGAVTCSPAFEELDTRQDVRTVLVGCIHPCTGSLEETVVP